METLGLKNVNMLTKEQYDGVSVPATDELWAVETETYSDEFGNWYRIYPDGWIEQGGKVAATAQGIVINLLKPYSNANYSVMRTNESSSTTGSSARMEGVYSLTKTSFTVDGFSGVTSVIWEAKGQGE
jgi:hypothetical protein